MRLRYSLRRPVELGLAGPGLVDDARRGNAGSEPPTEGSPHRMSTPAGRGGCRAGTARPLAGAGRGAGLPSRGNVAFAGRSIALARGAGIANGIARSEH